MTAEFARERPVGGFAAFNQNPDENLRSGSFFCQIVQVVLAVAGKQPDAAFIRITDVLRFLDRVPVADPVRTHAQGHYPVQFIDRSYVKIAPLLGQHLQNRNCRICLDRIMHFRIRKELLQLLIFTAEKIQIEQNKRSFIFVGDTLVIIQNNEGDPDTMATVLVGGSANNLLGDWSFTTCDYEAGSISCNNKPESYTIHYVFEADSQFVYYTLADGSCIPPESLMPSDGTLDKDESYTDTYAMLWLYNSIINIKKGDTKNISIYPYDFFLQSGGITIPSEVAISSQSKYAVTFTIGGQDFSATIGENTHRIQYYSDSQSEVDLDLASGSRVCHLHYFRDAKLTSETCKAENAPNFELDTHEETGVEYVDSFKIENIDEFKACLITLAQ